MDCKAPHQCKLSSHEDAGDFLYETRDKAVDVGLDVIDCIAKDSLICDNCDWIMGYLFDKLTENIE